jgi:hypothetical protein
MHLVLLFGKANKLAHEQVNVVIFAGLFAYTNIPEKIGSRAN